ncbi:hypothetical protein ANCCAN_23176 [Ancylostoma caninum]|uniref:Conserved oligomeric Golgi complex subunit 6 n=1 Tax=Ancylostoma caninum TaxID=29170 RepID=A0A368FHN1_ANCCA|nr:hypothetical protein ANCCAN_23176 [Ancylostoma caninum]
MEAETDGSKAAPPQSAPVDNAASVTNPIKRRIDKLVASKLHNDPEFIKVVDYVAPMVENLDIHTERRLLRSLEKRQLELNKEYLQEFEKVNAHVQDFAEKVRTMHRICSDLTNRIQQNKEKTQDLLSKTSALQNQKKHLEAKQKAIDDFLGRFSLTDAEKRALEGSTKDGTITSDFFPALSRARDIYNDSKELLRSNGEHSAAADYVEMKAVLCQSFAALQEREVLLKYALDEICTARKNQILRLYIDALTKGTQSNGKPIELMSHDPLRYMGDMLAWIYEALEGERELLQMLLKDCNPQVIRDNSVSLLSQISSALCRPFKLRVEQALAGETDSVVLYRLSALFTFYSEKMTPEIGPDSELSRTIEELNQLTLNIFYSGLNGAVQKILSKDCNPQVIRDNSVSLLSQISSALCRPFKLRVEQALAGETDSVVLYRLSALFTFYSEKMTPEIGPDSELSRTIEELNQLTLNIFYSGLNGAVQKILSKMGAPDYDLLPVPAVHQILMLLRDILETHDGAMAGKTNSEEEFNKIFSCVLDPLYRSVQVAATHLHSPLDVAVYTLNCLSAIYSLVILYPFTDSRLEMIKALMEGNEDVLVSEEASTILANTGLINLYQKAAAHDKNQGPLSAIPGMDAASVNNIMMQFDVFLAQPDKYELDQIAKISSARTRESVKQRTVDNVVAAYSVVVNKLEDPFNAYQNVAYKSVEQVDYLATLSY